MGRAACSARRMDRVLRSSEIRAGDVLLSLGRSQWSLLMAWNGGCPYSHAAIAIGDGRLVEAYVPSVRERTLESLAHEDRPDYVDVYRPSLDDAASARIAAIARRLVGVPFATRELGALAWRTWRRNRHGRVPVGWRSCRDGPTCVELVYSVLADAIGFQLRERPRSRARLPWLDLRELWRETRGWQRSGRVAPAVGAACAVPCDLIPLDLYRSPGLRRIGRLAVDDD